MDALKRRTGGTCLLAAVGALCSRPARPAWAGGSTTSIFGGRLSHAKVAGGVRWRINESWRLTLSYLLNLYISRDIRNS